MKAAKLVIWLDRQTMVRLWDVARQYGQTPQEYVRELIEDALDTETIVGRMDPTAEQVLMMIMPALLAEEDDEDWERRESR